MHRTTKALMSLMCLIATASCGSFTPSTPNQAIPAPTGSQTATGQPAPTGDQLQPTGGHIMAPGAAHDPVMGPMPSMPGMQAPEGGATAGSPALDKPPTSYRLEVIPVLRKHCAACHTAGGEGAVALTMFNAQNEPQFDAIKDQIARMLLEIQSGRMPKGKPDSLTKEEFDVLDTWGAAEMPDN